MGQNKYKSRVIMARVRYTISEYKCDFEKIWAPLCKSLMIDMYVSKSLNNNEPRSNLHGFGPLFRTSIRNNVEKKSVQNKIKTLKKKFVQNK